MEKCVKQQPSAGLREYVPRGSQSTMICTGFPQKFGAGGVTVGEHLSRHLLNVAEKLVGVKPKKVSCDRLTRCMLRWGYAAATTHRFAKAAS